MRRTFAGLAVLTITAAGLVLTAPAAHAVTELTVGATYSTATADTGMCTGKLARKHYLWHKNGSTQQLEHLAYGYAFKAAGGVNKDCSSVVKTNAKFSTSMTLSVSMDSTTSTVNTDSAFSGSGGAGGYVGPAYTTSAAPYSAQRGYTMSAKLAGSIQATLPQQGYIGKGTNYTAASEFTGGCSGQQVLNNPAVDGPSNQYVTGRFQVYLNHGLQDDTREGKPGFCVVATGTQGADWGRYTQNPAAWANGSTTYAGAATAFRYGAYPDATGQASTKATPGAWIDLPADYTDPTFCASYGGSVLGHYDNQLIRWGGHLGWTRQQYSPNPCTPAYPWDVDPTFHPPSDAYNGCMGYPQVGVPMLNHAEQYVNKLVLFYNPNLYPLGYAGPLKEGEFCSAVVPAEGYENAAASGIQVRMTLPTISGTDVVAGPRASSGTRVAVNSPPGAYTLGQGDCILVEGWSRMFSATENAIYDFFEFCGPLDKLPQPYTPHQIEERVAELYGNAPEDCIQIFGRYMFFDSIWQGSCDAGTFVAITDPVPGAGTWAGDHPITLDLRCNRLTPDVNESRTVAAHLDGGTSWNFNGYRCAYPIFGTAAEHSTKIWIHPRATYPQLNPNEIRFGT